MLDKIIPGRSKPKPPEEVVVPPPPAPSTFETLDANRDSALTPEELKDSPFGQRFAECDKDGDGRLTPAEFAACGG
jgi:hypothetical protein